MIAARALSTIALIAAAAGKPHHDGCHDQACVERVARKQCSQERVVPCIRRAALHRRVSFALLLRRAGCESRLDPHAQSGPNLGLNFQFNAGTWTTTPYRLRSVFSAKWASLGAAWMQSIGRGGEWACQ